ncbi:uncharacterized protein LOC115465520 isoform X2 [Microcaecilia unicolor]|uniref:Uncharacterized protein LOC115465520 isoform X2 n=1 Tax=Microcaecilia unicolor TaxID=1415580 RepID=A0A6P7X8J2_9AMPH|nr:uncharacterized protein LOC115465520 isoform X2 [Microcaecilia unicolor]
MKGALNIFYFGLAAAIAFVAAVEEEELTEMQKKVLGLSLQEYHKKEHVINAFKVSSIQSITETRRLNCVTCYKIEEESLEVVSSYMDCIPEQLLQTDREEGRREKCNEVKQTRETGLGLPGIFSFSRSRH